MKTMLVIIFLLCGQAIGQTRYTLELPVDQTNVINASNWSTNKIDIEYMLLDYNNRAARSVVVYTNNFTPLDILRKNGKIPTAIIELRDSGELCAVLGHQWHEGTSYGIGTDIARQLDCIWCKKVKKQVIKRQPATFWEDQP